MPWRHGVTEHIFGDHTHLQVAGDAVETTYCSCGLKCVARIDLIGRNGCHMLANGQFNDREIFGTCGLKHGFGQDHILNSGTATNFFA